MLLLLAQKAAEHQLLVCYCAARTTPTAFPTNGLWYDEDVSEQDVLKSWHALAALLWRLIAPINLELIHAPSSPPSLVQELHIRRLARLGRRCWVGAQSAGAPLQRRARVLP